MAGMDWFRWHHGSVTDPKFQLVARKTKSRVADVIAVWAFILESASQSDDRGAHGDLDFESIDCALGLDDGQALAIHAAMIDRAIVTSEGRVAAWERRQPKREREDDNSTERSKALRMRRRQSEPGDTEQHQATPESANCNHATPCNAMQRHATPRVEESREDKRREEDVEVNPPLAPRCAKSNDEEGDFPQHPPPTTQAGTVCKAMKAMGLAQVNPSNQTLATLIEAGASVHEFQSAASDAVKRGKGFSYALQIVVNERKRAADLAGQVLRGVMPSKTEVLRNRNQTAMSQWLAEQGENHATV